MYRVRLTDALREELKRPSVRSPLPMRQLLPGVGLFLTVTLVAGLASAPLPRQPPPKPSPPGPELSVSGSSLQNGQPNAQDHEALPPGTIVTVAGGGAGDGPALKAYFNYPHALAKDAHGNLFILESVGNRVRKLTPSGEVVTVAGTGEEGFSGDGGPAVNAAFRRPGGIAVDVKGNLYIADSENHRIRKISPDGFIRTVAGTEPKDVYPGGQTKGSYSGDGGPALAAHLNLPQGITSDGKGNLYIADTLNYRVRRVSPDGMITTVAGVGPVGTRRTWMGENTPSGGFAGDGGPATQAHLDYPDSLSIGRDGSLYIGDRGNARVRKVDPNGIITTVAGKGPMGYGDDGMPYGQHEGDGGPAVQARLNYIQGLSVDPKDNLYIADTLSHVVRRVDSQGIITTVAGQAILRPAGYSSHQTPFEYVNGFAGDGGPAVKARLNNPYGVLADGNGILYVADSANGRIRKVTTDGIIRTVAGRSPYAFPGPAPFEDAGKPARQARLSAMAVAADGAGNLFLAGDRIYRVDPRGIISVILEAERVRREISGGTVPLKYRSFSPFDLAADGRGNLYIADVGSQRILKLSPQGVLKAVAGSGTQGEGGDGDALRSNLNNPGSIAPDGRGGLYIADTHNNRIVRLTPDGLLRTVAGDGYKVPNMGGRGRFTGDGGPATKASLYWPDGVAPDGEGNLYIADTMNHRVRKVDRNGIIRTVAGNPKPDARGNLPGGYSGDGGPALQAELDSPTELAVDAAGNLFISERVRIRKVTPEGIISTVAGTVGGGFEKASGDGGPATKAAVSAFDIALDSQGNLYLAGGRVRKILRIASPNTSARGRQRRSG